MGEAKKGGVGDGVQRGNVQSSLETESRECRMNWEPGLLVETDMRLVLMVPQQTVVWR